jgi:hypothetical protein
MGTTEEMPDGPARCAACASTAVRIVDVDGHTVWLYVQHERRLLRPAGVATGSAGRPLA